MVTFLTRLGLFLILLIIGYVFLVIAWGEIAPARLQKNLSYNINGSGHLNTRLKEAKQFKDIDILFLGSSRAYRHYDPRIFAKNGFTSFNLGSSSQTFIQTEVLLKRYLSDLNPKIIVLDIYPGMFNSDGIESSLDVISNDRLDKWSFNMVLLHKNIKVLNTFIFSLYRDLVYNGTGDIEKRSKGENTYITSGYVEKKITRSKEIASDTLNFDLMDYQVDAFSNIISQIKEDKRELIIVQSPRHRGRNYKQESRLDSLFNLYNLNYLNYSKLSVLDDSEHFYNPMHLNQNGVRIYNNYIIKNIVRYLKVE